MSFKILHKQILAQDIKRVDIHAPDIAARALCGQFVSVFVDKFFHPMPMTIVDQDEKKGVISLIVHEVGPASRALGNLPIGDQLLKVVGPLGAGAYIDKFGTVVCVATGIGAAQILPICRALKKKGNKVIGIIGAKSKQVLMLETQMRVVCDEIFIATNDGSYERKGLATGILKELLEKYKVSCVYAIGGVDMMQAASQMTKPQDIPLFVTLNPYMTNGLGSCGSCRVKIGHDFKLACVDGPQFNGHEVDFEDLHIRMNALKETEWDKQSPHVNLPKKGLATIVKSLWGSPRR